MRLTQISMTHMRLTQISMTHTRLTQGSNNSYDSHKTSIIPVAHTTNQIMATIIFSPKCFVNGAGLSAAQAKLHALDSLRKLNEAIFEDARGDT